jgi:hypothetical protein
VIRDLDHPESRTERPTWLLPAATLVVVLAFIGVATASVGTRQSAAPAAGPGEEPAPAGPQRAGGSAPVVGAGTPPTWQIREAALEAASRGLTALALPPGSYAEVTRAVSGVTTGLHPAGEDPLIQIGYRLADGREVALARMSGSDALRDLSPLAYTTAVERIRGGLGRIMTGRANGEPTVLVWTEGAHSYQLSSVALSAGELIALAEKLR